MSQPTQSSTVNTETEDHSEDMESPNVTEGKVGGSDDRCVNVNVGGNQSLNVQGGTNYFYGPIIFGEGSETDEVETLSDNQKRWLIIGICLNSVVASTLRTIVEPTFLQLYTTLVQDESIDTQTYGSYLKHYPDGNLEFLNYEPINNNRFLSGRNPKTTYDYRVQNVVDLSKLFLRTSMAFHTGFDDTCDVSTLLTFLIKVADFGARMRDAAQKVKDKVRNSWGHCNFTEWTQQKYNESFDLLADLISSLNLPSNEATDCIGSVNRWRMNGECFLSGSIFRRELPLLMMIKALQSHVQKLAEQTRIELLQDYVAIDVIEDNFDGINSTLYRFENEIIEMRRGFLQQEDTSRDLSERVASLEKKNKDILGNKFILVPGSKRTFIGRENYFNEIENHLLHSAKTEYSRGNKISLCGLGGVGKTSIAMEFIWRNHKEHYKGGVFWISGENDEAFINSFRTIAYYINKLSKDSRETFLQTLNYISLRQGRCIFVLDNVDEDILSENIQEFTRNRSLWDFHDLIITTRRKANKSEVDFDCKFCLTIQELHLDEASIFVKEILHYTSTVHDISIRNLCETLQCLPLALEQAATKIKLIKCSIDDYLMEFEAVRIKLLDNPIDRRSVLTTWTINIESIMQKAKGSGLAVAINALLSVIAYLSKDDIHIDVFNEGYPVHDNAQLRQVLKSDFQKRTVLALFTEFSILSSEDGIFFRVHTLVQEAIRNQMNLTDSELEKIATFAIAMLNKATNDADSKALMKIEGHCVNLIHHFRHFEHLTIHLERIKQRASDKIFRSMRYVAMALACIAHELEKERKASQVGLEKSPLNEGRISLGTYFLIILKFAGAFIFSKMVKER